MQYIESDTLMFVSVVALLGWICWLYHKKRQQQAELKRIQLQLASSALDKFGSAGEFLAFLQSRDGQAMLYDHMSPGTSRTGTNMRLVRAGILLAFVAAGLFIGASVYPGTPDPDLKDVIALLNFSATIASSMAVGLWVVAMVNFLWERRFRESERDRT
jgi:hypothetical protein